MASKWKLTFVMGRKRKPEVCLTFPSFDRAHAAAVRIQEAYEGVDDAVIQLEEVCTPVPIAMH
jgi:hypothetical protein